jgi:hypothetical protein
VPNVRTLRSLSPVILSGLVLAGIALYATALVAPEPARAACGGGGGLGEHGWLARYAGRKADSIILGRLIKTKPAFTYHFELLEVYRGEAPASPVQGDVTQVGACVTGERVRPGRLFVLATGDRARHGPMKLIFPYVPGKGWTFEHYGNYSTLDHLLVLLGVLPATSTETVATALRDEGGQGWAIVAVAGWTWFVYWALGRRRQDAPSL